MPRRCRCLLLVALVAGGAACQQSRPSPGGGSVASRAPERAHGSSSTGASIQFGLQPADLSSAVGQSPISVVFTKHDGLDDALLSAVAAGVTLETHPEGEAIPFLVEAQGSGPASYAGDPDRSASQPMIAIKPSVRLEGRWYRLRVKLVAGVQPDDSGMSLRSGQNEVVSRFRPDSEVRLRRIVFCPQAVKRYRITVELSEPVYEPLDASPVRVTQAGRECQPADLAGFTPSAAAFLLDCVGFDGAQPWTLRERIDELGALRHLTNAERARLRTDFEDLQDVVPEQLMRGAMGCLELRK